MVDDAYTRNEDGELAVRTVSTSGDTGTNPNDVFTRDDEGRLAIRTTGGGGGDQHNLGYFATQAALEEAHPTAEAGDWAIVGATDTVWLWDSDNSQWVDSDQKGQVTSVNGQTGTVVLTASDVGALPSTTPIPDFVQYSTMPTASADNLGDIVQFTGTTDASYTNGYFYKCTGAGDPAVYSWTRVDVQPTPVIPDPLPSQTGQSGKFLTTDGTNASWSDKPLVNTATGANKALTILGTATAIAGGINIGGDSQVTANYGVAVGSGATTSSGVSVGASATSSSNAVAVGYSSTASAQHSVGIGHYASATATNAIQLGGGGYVWRTNSDANTFKVGNANGNYEIMSADGTIPADRLTHAINKYSTMPTASASNEGWIVQFTGTTDSTYTHGYLYECKAQGTDPETYAWEQVSVGGGNYLPLTGGALTGRLTFDGSTDYFIESNTSTDGFNIGYTSGSNEWTVLKITNGNIYAGRNGITDLGVGNSKFRDIYGTNLIGTYIKQYSGGYITIPTTGGKMAVQVSTLPTAASGNVGEIYQYIGATDSTYTNGHFYKCVSDGQSPATYSWEEVSFGGGSSYTAGTGIDITNDVISVTSPVLVNSATAPQGTSDISTLSINGGSSVTSSAASNIYIGCSSSGQAAAGYSGQIAIGQDASCYSNGGVAIGASSYARYDSIAIGLASRTNADRAIQIGARGTNSEAGTMYVALENSSYQTTNYKLLDTDGTVPTARLTKVNTTATLAVADWSSNTQTVSVTGVAADSVVFVSPAPASASDYASAGILCTAQAAGTLTFTCDTVPSNAITVNVVCL